MHLKKIIIDQSRFPTHEDYPFHLPVFQNTTEIDLTHPVAILTGENGSGKSTLLKGLCRRCNIHIWEGAERTPYQHNPYENMLPRALDIEWTKGSVQGSFFSPELFRNYSQLVDEWAAGNPGILKYYGGSSLVAQSHGQSCMAYFNSIYKVKGLYFLDEPESALSPKSQLEFLRLLNRMCSEGHAQFIIATHSPIVMSCNQALVYDFNGKKIEPVSFKETEHYKVYSEFFASL